MKLQYKLTLNSIGSRKLKRTTGGGGGNGIAGSTGAAISGSTGNPIKGSN